jgi:O-methyltransferase domain/Dimerisation domain
MNPPDPTPVTDLIDAFRRSKAMFTAVSMGVFDILAAGPADLDTLAARLKSQPASLARLLDACAGLGFLRKQDGKYANEPVADVYLTTDSPRALIGYIKYSDAVLYQMWGHLDDAVREGTHRWRQTFDFDGPIFSHFFRTDESMRTFMHGMHGFGLLSSPAVVEAFDLGGFRRMVDLGGGTGHLVIAACERYPELHGAVFDLPRVMTIAREEVNQSPAKGRIELLEGDFFENDLPVADLYAVARVLHDWAEEKIDALLRKIYLALSEGGAVLVAERLLDDDKTGPSNATMQSLNMLVCTEGRERNVAEYEALLRRAGFGRVEARRTGKPVDAVMGWK